jgi:hypothetical protein
MKEHSKMDDTRFDGWVRGMADGLSRRGFTRTLGVALAALAVTGGAERAVAKCAKVGKKCGKKKKCCKGAKCQGKRCRCTRDSQCGSGRLCVEGACVADSTPCPGDTPTCGGVCCGAGDICVDGTCVTGLGTCTPGVGHFCNSGEDVACNDNPSCSCFETLAGETRCGLKVATSASCLGSCTVDADCEFFGKGAFCVANGSVCDCIADTTCVRPCPS